MIPSIIAPSPASAASGPATVAAAKSPAYGRFTPFDVSASGMTKVEDFVFGTGAVSTDSVQKTVKTLADLGQYFNPVQDFTGYTSINNEVQRYQPFNAVNHAFLSDRLELRGRLDATKGYTNGWTTKVSQVAGTVNLNGANDISVLGWTTASDVQVGQMVIFQYKNTISIISAINGNTVTLQTVRGGDANTNQFLMAVIPVYLLFTSAGGTSGATTLTFATLPAGVKVGMSVGCHWNNNRTADHIITAINGATLTIDTGFTEYGDFGSGAPIMVIPPLTSGQIWTKTGYDLTRDDAVWGFDLDVVFATDSGGGACNSRGVNTLAAYQALPADYPMGYFPCAGWLYKQNNGTYEPSGYVPNVGAVSSLATGDTSEKDFAEVYLSSTTGYYGTLNNDLGPGAINPPFFIKNQGDGFGDGGNNIVATPYTMSGAHRISCIIAPGNSYTFLDDKCIRQGKWTWTGVHPAQMGIDLAVGSLAEYFTSTLLMPMSAAGIGNMSLGIKRLRTYCSNPS